MMFPVEQDDEDFLEWRPFQRLWTYNQRSGRLERDGIYVATGYSGAGEGKNNPTLEQQTSVGPIPRGRYQIGRPHTSKRTGPHVMQLVPVNHQALGRTDFQIHGDSREAPGSASTGCIILPRAVREIIAEAKDNLLEVVAGDEGTRRPEPDS